MSYPELSRFKYVSLDCETTGLDWKRDKVFGVAISTPDGKDYYYDTRVEGRKFWDWLKSEAPRTKIVNHNMKFDLHFMWNEGVETLDVECTMIRACLIDEHLMTFSLDYCARKYLKAKKVDPYQELADMFGGRATRNAQMPNLQKAPFDLVSHYAKMDSRLALDLWEWQEKEIERQSLSKINNFEKKLFPHLFLNERRGLKVNVKAAERTAKLLNKRVDQLKKKISEDAGFPVNPNPSSSIKKLFQPKQDKDGVWRSRDGTRLDTTAKGNPSITKDALIAMTDPAAKDILKCRKFDKASGTFLRSHIIEREYKGRVYANINQVKGEDGGTSTGRLSYTAPALQQIPSRDEEIAALVRPVFVPDDGQRWVYGDLDQHEVRWFAHYINNDNVNRRYAENPDTDFHTYASEVMQIPRNASAESGMLNAKQMNLAMIFNYGEGTLCEALGFPTKQKSFINSEGETITYMAAGEEGQAMINRYHDLFDNSIRDITKNAKNVALKRGYLETICGRHIRFPYSWMGRKAAGLLYQSSSADANKMNIMSICDILEGTNSNLLLNIHDEYSMSMGEGDMHLLHDIKKSIQDNALCRVPLRIDFSQGADNWWDATCADKYT